MEKTNNFHITFQKLMMEEYAESLLGCKITINFFLLTVFWFYTLTSSCVSLSLIHSSIVIEHHSALTLTRKKKDVETSPSAQLCFLVRRPRAASFLIHPKLHRTDLCRAVLPSFSNKGLHGKHPVHRMPESSGWGPICGQWPRYADGHSTSFFLWCCFGLGSDPLLAQSRISEWQPGNS